jgi:hypothetical protein
VTARANAGAALLEQGMPDEEVLVVLSSRDPGMVRRHLELHRERVIERQADERNAVDVVERILVSRIDPDTLPRAGGSTIEPWAEPPSRSGERSQMPSWGTPVSPAGPASDDPRAFGSIARSTRCS